MVSLQKVSFIYGFASCRFRLQMMTLHSTFYVFECDNSNVNAGSLSGLSPVFVRSNVLFNKETEFVIYNIQN